MADFSEYGGKSEEWKRLEASLPPAPDLTEEELKRTTNVGREDVAREQMKKLAAHVTIKDYAVSARDGTKLDVRSYRPNSASSPTAPLPIYIHYHGGGFFFGTLKSEDATCAQIAIQVGVLVVNINYRHTPEFTYPTAWDDAEDGFYWVYAHAAEIGGDSSQIVIGGVSAGGELAASLAQTLHRERAAPVQRGNIVGQVLMIPCLVHEDSHGEAMKDMRKRGVSSYIENEFAPILPLSRMRMFMRLLLPTPPSPQDHKLNPGNATAQEVAGMPPTTFGICGLDPLRDEGLLYAKTVFEAGVPINVSVFKGVPHGFSRFGDKLEVCKAWEKVMHDGIRWALSKPSPPKEWHVEVY